ncbi:MAG TPA: hypothetical protein VFV86_12260 [Nitrososphaeraceae archaeon]|nr:hypothetical protein [Nitrososphaeraceae archaeon]
MKPKTFLAIIFTFSILTFFFIGTAETTFSIFENAIAQENTINSSDSVNNTILDKDKGTSRSSTDFSAINETMTD